MSKGLKIAGIGCLSFIVIFFAFFIGVVAGGSRRDVDCKPEIIYQEVVLEREVVSPDLLEEMELHVEIACVMSKQYVAIFDVAQELVLSTGNPVHQDWYDIEAIGIEYMKNFCK